MTELIGKLYDDGWVTQYQGNALEILKELPRESVQMVCTSPPYWGLRKYSGNQDLVWGENHCEHEWKDSSLPQSGGIGDYEVGRVGNAEARVRSHESKKSDTCLKCGATKSAFGLEKSPEEYIAHSIEFLRAIRRVLRKDGVVFWNIGDSYISGAAGHKVDANKYGGGGTGCFGKATQSYGEWTGPKARNGDGEYKKKGMSRVGIKGHPYLKSKDLCLIPFRLAIAAQEDGWYIRSVIIWSKLNPMPESVKDRPTESHEYILMMTKSPRYYWDMEAVREPQTNIAQCRTKPVNANPGIGNTSAGGRREGFEKYGRYAEVPGGRNLRSVWTFSTEPFGMEMCKPCQTVYEAKQYHRLPEKAGGHKCKCANKDYIPSWLEVMVDSQIEILEEIIDVSEQGYQCEYCGVTYTPREYEQLPEAKIKICRCGESDWLSHFATYPKQLVSKCVLAATSEKGCCPKCGQPWERVVEKTKGEITEAMRIAGCDKDGDYQGSDQHNYQEGLAQSPSDTKRRILESTQTVSQTIIWQPRCSCDISETVPCVVLDPFSGSGTTGQVAKELGRKAILIDISEEYCKLAVERVNKVTLPMELQ